MRVVAVEAQQGTQAMVAMVAGLLVQQEPVVLGVGALTGFLTPAPVAALDAVAARVVAVLGY